jgi:integrase
MFLYGMKAPMTREKYKGWLARFFDFIATQDSIIDVASPTTIEQRAQAFADKAKKESGWVFASIFRFTQAEKERVEKGEISPATLANYIKAIKLFCEMNDVEIAWKKITRGLPKARRFANDRAPTLDEIHRIIQYPDRRIKPIVYTMTSSGIRLEAWNYLRWGHVKPIDRDDKVVAAKMIVYSGDPEEYFTFITPEAYFALSEWMKFREQSGEVVNANSWVMRDVWDTKRGCIMHFVTVPKKLKAAGLIEQRPDPEDSRSKIIYPAH